MKFVAEAASTVLIALAVFCEVSTAQSIHQFACPYAAAEKLTVFENQTRRSVARKGAALLRNADDGDWGFAQIRVEKVVGLRGRYRDPLNPLNGYFISYVHDARANTQTSMWAYEYGRTSQSMVDYGRHPAFNANGFVQFRGIQNSITTKDFLFVEHVGSVPFPEIIRTNTIFASPGHVPTSFARFRRINEQLLASEISTQRGPIDHDKTLFITSSLEGGEEMITLYDPPYVRSYVTGRTSLVGRAYKVKRGDPSVLRAIAAKIRTLGRDGRVYVYGDELRNIDIAKIADRYGVDIVRRGPETNKSFAITEQRLAEIGARKFIPAETVFMNGTPRTVEELRRFGFPEAGLDAWKARDAEVEATMQDKFSRRIENREQLIREFQDGESDVVVMVGHSDGERIYFGAESISVGELSALSARTRKTARPRLAVLISCGVGRLSKGTSFWSWKEPRFLGETLVSKGFVDAVIAPDRDISAAEGVEALKTLLNGQPLSTVRSKYPGWKKIAQGHIYVGRDRS